MESLRQYNVRLPEELIQTLQDVAKETGRDRAGLVRDALTRYFDGELWRDETTKSGGSLHISAKVEDLERRVRRLEIAQPATQHTAKTDIQAIQSTAKRDIQTAKKAIHRPAVVASDETVVKRAKEFILAELEAGREPTTADVAEAIGEEAEPLGRLMRAEGIPAKNTRRKGVGGRYYTFDLKPKIEELIAKGELEK